MPLTDEDTGVVDRLGEATLEDLGLETTLQEVLDLEGEHVIETHAVLVEHADAHETANKGVTLKQALGVLVVELEKLTRRTTDLGQNQRNAPDLALVAETVLARELYVFSEYHTSRHNTVRALSSMSRRGASNGRRGTL